MLTRADFLSLNFVKKEDFTGSHRGMRFMLHQEIIDEEKKKTEETKKEAEAAQKTAEEKQKVAEENPDDKKAQEENERIASIKRNKESFHTKAKTLNYGKKN